MSQSRYTQFLRLFYLAESLRGLRYGLTVADIREEVSERMGQSWCERTIARDLESLAGLALVEQAFDGRWCWAAAGSLLDQQPERIGAA